MKPILLCAALAALPAAARADQTVRLDVDVRVGQTLRLQNISAHRADCSGSDDRSVEIAVPPSLGRIALRDGVPATVRRSLSGTCVGAHLTGIGVDYTATRAGIDRFEFDGVFRNGRARYIVTARDR